MRYLSGTIFSGGGGNAAYEDGWERTFGTKEKKPYSPPTVQTRAKGDCLDCGHGKNDHQPECGCGCTEYEEAK